MAGLINSNMIIYSIAMNKNTGVEDLTREFAALPQALEALDLSTNGTAIILARLVRGASCDKWEEASANLPLAEWHALPVDEIIAGKPGDAPMSGRFPELPISPFRETPGVLTRGTLIKLLERELMRLSRQGGSLSILAAALTDKFSVATALGKKTADRLEAMLGLALLSKLEACDAVGLIQDGIFICSLPGIGQLAARHFAETACDAFSDAARPFFPAGGLGAGQSCGCSVGIVNLLPGETSDPAELLKRARATLDIAKHKPGVPIHQETAMTPLDATTLVQSSEKRFLFFGGDPK